MNITNEGLPTSESSFTQAESSVAVNGTSDINFFSAQLNPTGQPNKEIRPAVSGNLFNIGAPESAAADKRVKRGVRDMMLNKRTQEAHALPESLAAANLNVVTRVKLLSLLVKGVDKIATMG
ncbi:hypothetical protein HF257_25975 [Pseudomonas sp. WS 5106]|uniref:Uncharacterized protein n=1 Tax=Pseudomonas cremoris TaxID=2724178 RepID=A0A7X1ARP0_9PSED|nr:hypothetical protein [Pseudomonas cremoris]MBC2409468.1 hypothetical protein [Pseudomonas cremoris]